MNPKSKLGWLIAISITQSYSRFHPLSPLEERILCAEGYWILDVAKYQRDPLIPIWGVASYLNNQFREAYNLLDHMLDRSSQWGRFPKTRFLLAEKAPQEKTRMVGSIGPFGKQGQVRGCKVIPIVYHADTGDFVCYGSVCPATDVDLKSA